MLQRPKDQSSNVVITIKYGGLKATQFFSKYTTQAYKQLLEDLKELGFPFPKKSNIVFLSHGTLEFFWPIAVHEKSRFVTSLVSRVNLPIPGLFKDEQTAMRRQLSIFSLTVREDRNYDPSSQSQNTSPQVSQTLSTRVATPNKPPPEILNNAARYHPYSRPQPPATLNNNEGHRVSEAKPVSRTIRAAEPFLDQVETTLDMAMQPKSEPAAARPGQQSSPSYPKTPESQIAGQRVIQVKQENSSPKLSKLPGASALPIASNCATSWPAPPPPAATSSSPSLKYYSQNQSTPTAVPPRNRNANETSNVPPSASHPAPTMLPQASPTSSSGHIRSMPLRDPPREIAPPPRPPPSTPAGPLVLTQPPRKPDTTTTSDLHAPVSHQYLKPPASRGTMLPRATPTSNSMPTPAVSLSSLPQTPTSLLEKPTNQILSSLDESREKIVFAIERHNCIVDELDQRKVTVLPPKLSLLSSDDEAATKARILEMKKALLVEQRRDVLFKSRMEKLVDEDRARQTEMDNALEAERGKRVEMENALESERGKRVEVEMVLSAERTRRIELENVLKDIERECKSPFIVPALLDSFIQISQATTAAINHQASSKMDI